METEKGIMDRDQVEFVVDISSLDRAKRVAKRDSRQFVWR